METSKKIDSSEEDEKIVFEHDQGIQIDNNIYLGNAKVGRNMKWLSKTGISRIFNLTKNHNNDLKTKYGESNISFSRFWFSEHDLIAFSTVISPLLQEIVSEINNNK